MTELELQTLFEKQKSHKWTAKTTSAQERIAKIRRLKEVIIQHRADIYKALYEDFRKPQAEVEVSEIFPVLEEIQTVCAKLEGWMKPQAVSAPLTLLGTRSEIRYEARGQVLVMAPWNYPFNLFMIPVISAFAAGNVVIGRPSNKVTATSKVCRQIISQVFSVEEVAVVEGDTKFADQLLALPFDHIFFTGSTSVGKKVMRAAAEHLASVTLELGGKSPTIVHQDADIQKAAERIVWAKFINAGQTCIAPDYCFVHESIHDQFLQALTARIRLIFGNDPKANPDLARVIDTANFQRLQSLVQKSIESGAKLSTDSFLTEITERYIPPTVLSNVKTDHALMGEEIFGPILPVMKYADLHQVIQYIRSQPKPLALYLFTKDSSLQQRVLNQTTSGGAVINHLLIHFGNNQLPFGGVGASGLGHYHGHFGFKTFSHERSVVYQGGLLSMVDCLKPPYSSWLSQFSLKFLKFLTRSL